MNPRFNCGIMAVFGLGGAGMTAATAGALLAALPGAEVFETISNDTGCAAVKYAARIMPPASILVMAFIICSLSFFWQFGNAKFHCPSWRTAETTRNCQGASRFKSIALAIA